MNLYRKEVFFMPAYKDTTRNTWYVKFRYTDWQGNRKETTKRGFPTKREAKEYEEEFKRKIQGTSDMSFSNLFKIYIDDRRQHIKGSSLYGVKTTLEKHVLPSLGQLPISKITPNVIRKWQNELNNKDLRPPTILTVNRRLSALLNFAVKFYGLPRNPMKITGTQGKQEKNLEYWSKEEFNTFVASVKSPLYKALFLTLFYSGMRIGEALALTPDDVDFASGKVTINKSINRRNQVTPPKTASSNRTLTLPAHVIKFVQEAYSQLSYESERVFPVSYSQTFYHFKCAIQLSGVRPLKIHALRHAHASILINEGIPITAVAKRLGHTSPQITLSVYAHASDDSDKRIAKLLDSF